MDQQTVFLFFNLLRIAMGSAETAEGCKALSPEGLTALLKIAAEHDLDHLLLFGVKQTGQLPEECAAEEKRILKAVYRHERMQYEYARLCDTLEKAEIPFLPLKGAVIRKHYPNPWMRTSGDIDVLVHREDLEKARASLVSEIGYKDRGRASHDVLLVTPSGIYVELHFDLVEEGIANESSLVLSKVWDTAVLRDGYHAWYEMTDEMFYFYHIAHMAKHFETGGCGIRPFLDLYLLDRVTEKEQSKRNELLIQGDLLKFAEVARTLSKVWFEGKARDSLSQRMEDYILSGGVYGNNENRIALQQQKQGGKIGFILDRVFLPYSELTSWYPILHKHRYWMPIMQVRRWFHLLTHRRHTKRVRRVLQQNNSISVDNAKQMKAFLNDIGL